MPTNSNLPTLYHELPYQADASYYFERIRHLAWPVFFDSYQPDHPDSRYSIITAAPFQTLLTKGAQTDIEQNGINNSTDIDPFLVLQQQLTQFEKAKPTSLPFCGGAIGLFCYDLARQIEQLPEIAQDDQHYPEMLVGLYDWAIVVDHQTQKACLASMAYHQSTNTIWPQLIEQLANKNVHSQQVMTVSGKLSSETTEQNYQQTFNRIKHYIKEGDCYQVNLAKRFSITANGDPWHAYQLLRQNNPAPFSAYFETPHVTILSSSPERLLKLENNHVETKPIKGTRPRDLSNQDNDLALANVLKNSTKDLAENLMIVDLLRNDLGKVCKPGSINVPKPFAIESFATVHHMVSTVTGQLADDQNAVSLLRACFPGGSITGAPKLRAMEIIEELEHSRRGAYCGSIAYIGFDGRMDSNILIRTLVYNEQSLHFWAGGGIVADSDSAQEYQEINDKAAAIFDVIEQLR